METIKRIRSKIGVEIKAGFWYTVGNFFLKGIAFITMPIFTRLLSTDDYGLVSLFNTWAAVLTIIVALSLNSSVIRGYHEFKDNYDEYLSSTMFLSMISFLVFGVIISIFRDSFVELIGFSYPIIILILLQSYFLYVISFNNSKYVCQYMYKKSLFISISKTLSGVILSIVLIFLMSDNLFLGKVIGTLIPTVIAGIIIFIIIMYKGKKLINITYWKFALLMSVPMIPHLIGHLILGQSDRILIDRFVGSNAVGIYSFAYNVGLISQVLLASLNSAWVPWFYKKMDEKNNIEIVKKSKNYITIFVILITGLIFISPELVRFMAPSEYKDATWIVPIIIISYFFQFLYNLLVNVQFYFKKNLFIPIGTMIAAIINIGLNIYFIPKHGYAAAVYTTLISYIILFVMHYIVTRYIIKSEVYRLSLFIKPSIIVIVLTLIFYCVLPLLLVRYMIILFIGIFLILSNRKFLIDLIK
ncbi:MAG: lipopolysaccharide biosynthesis protein [Tissierella sp.]|uniref:lipopolysaccharide biosynthesis protein n=1 Tax=Tissierella sp. TaxID=41274 RepID=UPI003F9B1FC8